MISSWRKDKFRFVCLATSLLALITIGLNLDHIAKTNFEIEALKEQVKKESYSNKYMLNAIKLKEVSAVNIKNISDNKINDLEIDNDLSNDQNKLLTDEVAALKDYILRETGKQIVEVKKVKLEVTMYTNNECGRTVGSFGYGQTASGIMVSRGSVAMPDIIPFGSQVIIDGVTENNNLNIVHTVTDRGGAIIKKSVDGSTVYKLDVYTNDLQEALNWGVKEKEGWIYYVK